MSVLGGEIGKMNRWLESEKNKHKIELVPGRVYELIYRQKVSDDSSRLEHFDKVGRCIKIYKRFVLFEILNKRGTYRECFLIWEFEKGIIRYKEVGLRDRSRGENNIKSVS